MARKRKRQSGPEPTAAEGEPEPTTSDLFSLCKSAGTAAARPFSYIRSLRSHASSGLTCACIRHTFNGWVSALLLHQSDIGQTAALAQNIQAVMDKVDEGDEDVLNELEHLHSAVQLSLRHVTGLLPALPAALFGEVVFAQDQLQ